MDNDIGINLQKNSFVTGTIPGSGIFVLVISLFLAPVSAIELKTAAQRSAPKYFTQADSSVGGLCVDIMHAIEDIEPELKFSGYQDFLPFKRLQHQLETGDLDVFFGLKKTAKRKNKYIFLDNHLYQVNYVIAVRSEDTIDIESLDDLRELGDDGALATVKGTAASQFLRNHGGLLIRENVTSPAQLVKILMAGRVRFIFYHDLGLRESVRTQGLEKHIRVLPVSFSTHYHYVAFSRNTPVATIDKVDAALNKIRDNGRLDEIQRKYNLYSR